MSVEATIAALQALHAGIGGIKSAPTDMPASLKAAELPVVLVFPKPATWSEQAVGLPRQDRTYFVHCYVAPVAQGLGVDEGWSACLSLLQAFGEAYLADRTLGGAVDHIAEIADGGVETLLFAGTAYHGFIYRLRIVEK